MVKIKVELKERSYEILIGTDIINDLGKTIEEQKLGTDVFIITDPLVNDIYGSLLKKCIAGNVKIFEVPSGEKYKNLKEASILWDKLAKNFAHRDSLIIALGGGVIGDLAGFVAATYMRGIDYIQVPTTLLAQVDASIGGKTAVNHAKCKNMIGCFYQPKMVYIDVKTLTTLPAKEIRTGLAEIVKYGVIEDAIFFKFLEENAHHLTTKAFENKETMLAALKLWQTIVAESAKIKARIVEKDEREADLRMVLNYGHTVGHAIESLTSYKEYNHGEAVAIGMVAAAKISSRIGLLDDSVVERICRLLEKMGLPIGIKSMSASKIVKTLIMDKKVYEGKIKFVLPERLGKVVIRNDVPLNIVTAVVKEMGAK